MQKHKINPIINTLLNYTEPDEFNNRKHPNQLRQHARDRGGERLPEGSLLGY